MAHPLRILFVDAYDSFSNNIISLLEKKCCAHVTKIYIDTFVPDLEIYLRQFAAIVCGPGPGHPANPPDVGLFNQIWNLSDSSMIPVLGICLGFQSLGYHFGASVGQLPQPRHGVKTDVTTSSTSIFKRITKIQAVQYHSLHISLGETTHERSDHEQPDDAHSWNPWKISAKLQPLAWEYRSPRDSNSRFQKNPQNILMAVRHIEKPFFGIQFHPESVCSEPLAQHVIVNWWNICLEWTSMNHKLRIGTHIAGNFNGGGPALDFLCVDYLKRNGCTAGIPAGCRKISQTSLKLSSVTFDIDKLNIPKICTALNLTRDQIIILDSEMRPLSHLGETSIIGIVLPDTAILSYSTGSTSILLKHHNHEEIINLKSYDNDVFSFLKSYMARYEISDQYSGSFCGGLMGYISYEACLETIGISGPSRCQDPDVCFAFIERSILIDHKRHIVTIQSLHIEEDRSAVSSWLTETVQTLTAASRNLSKCSSDTQSSHRDILGCSLPDESQYRSKIARCQDRINAGDAYELCLTDQTSISLSGAASSWNMYCSLRRLNPAPFAGYVRLGNLTLISTSPERFMSWSREGPPQNNSQAGEPEVSTTCQFRPIKGTVQKRQSNPDGSAYQISREKATAILATQKEEAENLMIVDLIRHDLHAVCQNVVVKDLMVVEEYETIFQLVSVIEGQLNKGLTGIDCLAVSLPPGSMTGAPKKRSCQLLQELEDYKPRSIYSGILGYMCLSGKGDFSVVIRSMFKWDKKDEGPATWNIGAGGAITTLSTEEGEWQEMLTKLRSTFRLFDPDST